MAIELFGFSIGRSGKEPPRPNTSESGRNNEVQSFVPPDFDDGAAVVQGGGFYGSYIDMDGVIKNDVDLINKYRDMAMHPEIEIAVEDIVNESIVFDTNRKAIELNLEGTDLPDAIKAKMQDEFDSILKILKFGNRGYELFRKWYIESRLYFHVIPHENGKKGIKELRPIDPTKIRKVRNVEKKKDEKGATIINKVEEFYVYTDTSQSKGNEAYSTPSGTVEGIKVAPDSICFVPSGLYDATKSRVFGYLQKAIKPLNQLRMIEDAVVIYRISRAPERRIFYIDVGALPKNKAEQYLKDIMNRYRNKLVYDASTGEIRDDRKHMSMLEDYWLPRRDGGRGTEISTLDGGQNLGEMEDVEYFKSKLYRSLNIPISRLESENGFNMGRSSEITRDELKFFKFIERLRHKFSELFMQLMRTQCILKGIMTEDDWAEIHQDIAIDFTRDSYFTELKENEILKERMDILRDAADYIGKYYSIGYIRRNVLRQTEDEIKELDKEIKAEKDAGLHGDEQEDGF